jgi:L-threonylcarbamoyladenylate synthase
MKTDILSATSSSAIPRALEVLRLGRLVAFPTDTVYGVGALGFNGKAVQSIYVAKDRPIEKAIPILIGEMADLDQIAMDIPARAYLLAQRFWPGPLTILVPKRPDLPEAVSATSTIGVRVPDHEIARALLRAAGPLAVTSANLSGYPSPTTAEEVLAQLGGRIDLIIDGGKTPGGTPSTLVECTGDEIRILREGPITEKELLSALKPHRGPKSVNL